MKRLTAVLAVFLLATLGTSPGRGGAAGPASPVTFRDVTQQAGIHFVHNNGAFGKKFLPETLGPGVAVGDYDNDGFDDLFITALGQSRLFHNNGNGTFTDVTQKAGLSGPRELSTSAAWVDFDKDGHLDLVVGNYVQWTQETDLYCTLDGKS